MPESAGRTESLSGLLAQIEQAIGEGELVDAVALSRTLNARLRAHIGESMDPADIAGSEARVRLLLDRTATARSELMKKLSGSQRRRQAARAYQTT